MPLSPTKFNKLLIVAQYWAGDLREMQELLRLIADLTPSFCPSADFLLYPRVDTNCREFTIGGHLASKYGVFYGRSVRDKRGWPFGPNAVAMDAFRLLYERWVAGQFPYDGALLMESDCVPLRKTWLEELLLEWNSQDKLFLGHWDGSATAPAPTGHMNGNLIFHPSAIVQIPDMAYGEVPAPGWDMQFWRKIRPNATPSRLVFSDYRLNTKSNPLVNCEDLWKPRIHTNPENPLYGEALSPCYLHGCKGMKAIECVRSKFGLDL